MRKDRTEAVRRGLMARWTELIARTEAENLSEQELLELKEPDLAELTVDQLRAKVLDSLGEKDLIELIALFEALVRIDAGNYGRCAICNGEISEARLLASPEVSTCVSCAIGGDLDRAQRAGPVRDAALDRASSARRREVPEDEGNGRKRVGHVLGFQGATMPEEPRLDVPKERDSAAVTARPHPRTSRGDEEIGTEIGDLARAVLEDASESGEQDIESDVPYPAELRHDPDDQFPDRVGLSEEEIEADTEPALPPQRAPSKTTRSTTIRTVRPRR